MGHRIDPSFVNEIAMYGGDTVNKCFNCGNCTAVCALSEGETVFPRKSIRYMQLGMRDKLQASHEPWMCYYCGGCSDTCPREAEPGEVMMAMRRWLTAKYDWTTLSRRMYLSDAWEIGMLVVVALIVLALFTLPGNFGFRLLNATAAGNPDIALTVNLEHFAPKDMVHIGDLILAGLLGFFLLSNAARMWYFIMRGEQVSLGTYIAQFKELVVHGLTQKRWSKCDNDTVKHWVRHIFLVTGYATIFLLVVVFLPTFQVEDNTIHWTSYLGYYSTAILLGVTLWMMIDRAAKKDQIHKFSHLSDWLFLWLLFLTALSGIVMHLFRIMDMGMATYWSYMIHLMIAVPMLAVEVPFGKWSHLLYRPLAAYLSAVKARSSRREALTRLHPETAL